MDVGVHCWGQAGEEREGGCAFLVGAWEAGVWVGAGRLKYLRSFHPFFCLCMSSESFLAQYNAVQYLVYASELSASTTDGVAVSC